MQQRRFTSFDGTPIAYQVTGNPEGPPLLFANGLGGTMEAYRFIVDHFSDVFRFLCWDYRGLHASGRPVTGYAGLDMEQHARDGLALLDHEGVETCHAFGWSMGVQVLLEMHRDGADRFDSVVLHNGAAGRPYQTVAGQRALEHVIPPLLRGLQRLDGLVTRTVHWAVDFPAFVPLMVRLGFAHHDIDREVFLSIARGFKSLDLHLYLELLVRLGEHDATDILGDVACPTLVLASSHDLLTPVAAAEALARGIRHARLEVIAGGSHYAAVEFPTIVNRQLEQFYVDHFPALLSPPRATGTSGGGSAR